MHTHTCAHPNANHSPHPHPWPRYVRAQERKEIFESFDVQEDGKLNRMEFCALCTARLGHMSSELLDLAVQNMKLAQACALKRNKAYWRNLADTIESWARVIVPLSYAICLGVLFHTTFTDEYLTNNDVMFQGFGPATFSARGVALAIASAVIMVGCITG